MSSFADHSAARVHFASRRGQDGAVDVDLGSLSSVDAADAPPGDDSSLGLYDETMPLYQRLHELDQLTASFLQSRPLVLNDTYDTFSDLDVNRQQLFELTIPPLRESDVLCVSVTRVPAGAPTNNSLLRRSRQSGVQYGDTLDVALRFNPESSSGYAKASSSSGDPLGLVFLPRFHNGTYDIVVTPSHGLIPGRYLLDVTNQSTDEVVSVRVQHKLTHQVTATPIQAGAVLQGSAAANEFKFYRYVCPDPSRLITIRVRPQMTAPAGGGKPIPVGDPDLYVSNRYSGFVALTKDNAIWKSTTVGIDRVDIAPDDAEAQRGNTYIIGVLGCKKTNDFEIFVTTSSPEPITNVPALPGSCPIEVALSRDKYTYFKIPIDCSSKNKIIIKLEPIGASIDPCASTIEFENRSAQTAVAYKRDGSVRAVGDASVKLGMSIRHKDDIRASAMQQQFGRGVYAHDWFAEYGLYDAYFREKRSDLKTGEKLNSFSSFQLAFGRSSFFRSGSPPRESSSGGHNSGMVKATSALSFISSAALNSPESLDRSADIIDDEAHSYSHSNVFNSPTAAGYMSHHQSRGAPTSHPATPGAESKMDSIALSAALGVEAVALTHIFPPSACRDGAKGIYPVVFLSSTCIYPSEENYTWRASAADGSIMIVLDMDEWRHTNDVCYISVLGLSIPEAASLAVESNGIYNSVVASRTTAQYDQAVDELRVQLCSWVRQETSDMNEKDRTAYKMFDSIFNSIDGASASQRDRSVGFAPPLATENDAIGSKTTIVAKLMIDDDLAFTYGEIEFPSFLQILRTAQATDGQIFVDLGCGAGKAVVAAALSEVQFLRITGIELLPALTSCARKAVAGLREMIDKIGDSKSVTSHFEARIAGAFGSSCNLHLPLIDIKEGDILEIDWSDADLVYISSICFPENVLQRIFERATSLKVGSTLITLKLIPGFEKYFELKTEKWFKMTWGSILVYFLTRVASY